jgi:ATP-dependent helicase HrpB
MSAPLPIESVLPELTAALRASQSVALSAPPGAGKTSRVPLVLLEEQWMQGRRLIMLEPRRLAARRAAQYMASQLGQPVGGRVGYRIRGESRVSDATQIEVVTEGVLTRMLHEHSDLPGVALLVFDEFHERSIHADLGLALALDVQQHLRHDLKILVMSATLDGLAVSELLGGAPVVESRGRSYPVETRYLSFKHTGQIEPKVTEVIRHTLSEEDGDLLVFLPGQREIRRVAELLNDNLPSGVAVHSLYGEAGDSVQHAALAPAPKGIRKVILSTSLAETSLTIDGVRVVVDSGLSRVPQFDPRRGMSGLVTVPVSQASADQRRGRAGRQQPGVCYRLWTEEQHRQLPDFTTPEILSADLAPLALDLARWGAMDISGFRFLDPPPPAHLSQARNLLQELGALSSNGSLTVHGRAMSDLPVHPRLAHMLLRGVELGLGALACDVAALLEERDILRGQVQGDVDLASRLQALHSGKSVDRNTHGRVVAEAYRLKKLLGVKSTRETSPHSPGILLALAYPERIARRRGGEGHRYQMSGGAGAVLPKWSLLGRHEFLAVAHVDGVGMEVRIFLAEPVDKAQLMEVFSSQIKTKDEVYWNEEEEAVIMRRAQMLGAVVVAEQTGNSDDNAVRNAMLDGIRRMGLRSLPWTKDALSIKNRSEWLRVQGFAPRDWPDLSDEALFDSLDDWLSPFVNGMTRKAHLARLDMKRVLLSRFTHTQRKLLDTLAPAVLQVPTGSQIVLQYAADSDPVLAVKLQEMFGQTDTPTIADGKAGVVVHLLSPAGRPLAVTQDLRSFWTNAYPDVRKEMRGRYPKHPWPEDPLHAIPTRRTKRRTGS